MGERLNTFNAVLMFDGFQLQGRISDLSKSYEPEKEQVLRVVPDGYETTMTMATDMTYKDWRKLMRYILPNNWLKMHGRPKRRRWNQRRGK